MTAVEIPISNDAGNYNFQTELDGTDYILRFRYSRRAVAWYMDIKSANNTLLVMGIKVVVNIELLSSFKHLDIPQGPMVAINLENQLEEPTRDNFGTEIRMIYGGLE